MLESKRFKRRNRWRSRSISEVSASAITGINTEVISKAFESFRSIALAFAESLQVLGESILEAFKEIDLTRFSNLAAIAVHSSTPYKEFCRGCKYASREILLPCAVHPVIPDRECLDWESIAPLKNNLFLTKTQYS